MRLWRPRRPDRLAPTQFSPAPLPVFGIPLRFLTIHPKMDPPKAGSPWIRRPCAVQVLHSAKPAPASHSSLRPNRKSEHPLLCLPNSKDQPRVASCSRYAPAVRRSTLARRCRFGLKALYRCVAGQTTGLLGPIREAKQVALPSCSRAQFASGPGTQSDQLRGAGAPTQFCC